MKPTRRTQPMRKGTGRQLSAALKAATTGGMADGSNPMDAKRALEKQAKRKPQRGGLKGAVAKATAPAKVAAIPVRGSDGTPRVYRKLRRIGQVPSYARQNSRA